MVLAPKRDDIRGAQQHGNGILGIVTPVSVDDEAGHEAWETLSLLGSVYHVESCFVISPLGSFEVSTLGTDTVNHTSNGAIYHYAVYFYVFLYLFIFEIIEILGGYRACISND